MDHIIPGHALHEKGLLRQIGDDPLVSSQERRALLVLVISRLQTAYKPLINRCFCSAIGLNRILLVRASSGKTFGRRVFDALGNTRDDCVLGALFCSTPPRRPAVRPDPTRPLYVRVLHSTSATSCDVMTHIKHHIRSYSAMSIHVGSRLII